MNGIQPYCLSRIRRKKNDVVLNSIERFAFQSINGPLAFLGMTVSPFAAFASSNLQRTQNGPTLSDLVRQINLLRSVQKMGTTSWFRRPLIKGTYEMSVVMFGNAARPSNLGKLGYIGGLLIGPLEYRSILHTISWASHSLKDL